MIIINQYNIEELNSLYGEQIEKDYLNNMFMKDIEWKYFKKKSNYLTRKILLYRGIELKDNKQLKALKDKSPNMAEHFNNRKYKINQDYFKTWSHEMAYLLGYIATDGCINKNGRSLQLSLKREDESLLYKIKEELGYEGKITHITSKIKGRDKEYFSSRMIITNKEIINDLIKLGITPNKSLTLSSFDIPEEYEISFLLGVFDGDGCLKTTGKKKETRNIQFNTLIVSASYDFIKYLHDIFLKHGMKDVVISESVKNRKHPLYQIAYSTYDTIKFLTEAYNATNIFLDRKYNRFIEYINYRENFLKQKLSAKT